MLIFKFTAWLGVHVYYLKLRNSLAKEVGEQILVVPQSVRHLAQYRAFINGKSKVHDTVIYIQIVGEVRWVGCG